MELEVLVATVGQSDLSLHKKMNLHCSALIANQCGKWQYDEEKYEYGTVRMISSDTRGVGINRNLAVELAKAEILLFADDDIVYYDNELQGVLDAFEQLPDADIIVFGIDMARDGEVFDRRRHPIKKLQIWNALKFGACRTAIRKDALKKHNIHFSQLFGGGSLYGSGEDSLFLRDCFRAGMKVYSHSYVLGVCAKDSSSWFTGFNEKYVFDKGAWIACAFPKAKHFVKLYFTWRFSEKSGFSYKKTMKYINAGMLAFEKLMPYKESPIILEHEME